MKGMYETPGFADEIVRDAQEIIDQDSLPEATIERLEQLCGEFVQLNSYVEQAENHVRVLRAAQEKLRVEVIPAMFHSLGLVTPEGKGTFRLKGGGFIYLRTAHHCSVKAGHMDQFREWADENGILNYVTEQKVHEKHLEEIVTSVKNNPDDDMPVLRTKDGRPVVGPDGEPIPLVNCFTRTFCVANIPKPKE